MNKNDLIAAVAEKTGLTKAQAGEAVDATFDAVTETLKGGDWLAAFVWRVKTPCVLFTNATGITVSTTFKVIKYLAVSAAALYGYLSGWFSGLF